MNSRTTPCGNSARIHLSAVASILFVLAFASPAFTETTAEKPAAPTGISLDAIAAALQNNGFQAKLLENPPPALLGQILTGIAGTKVVIQAVKCDGAAATGVCALNFIAAFNDVPALPAGTMGSLNNAAFVKAGALIAKDGTTSGLAVTYLYPCEGLENATFVPVVLRTFGSGVVAVISAYQKLASAGASSSSQRPLNPSGNTMKAVRLESDPVRPAGEASASLLYRDGSWSAERLGDLLAG